MFNSYDEYKEFQTSTLPLAVTLSLYFSVLHVDKTNPKRVVFTFKKTDELEDFVEKYHARELRIEPNIFFNQLKTIKSRLYEEV